MKIINAIWFSALDGKCIGIVYGKDEITGEEKSYIGIGFGVDEEEDKKYIAENGAKFPIEAAKKL